MGSKGLPGKNIKKLDDKPLINYSVDFARNFADDDDICISTDSESVIKCVNEIGLDVPFLRPSKLSTDLASTYDVIVHALNYYKEINRNYELVVLLQPTSPFRKTIDLMRMLEEWNEDLDLMVSVKESKDSPYFNILEENPQGYLMKLKNSNYSRRQDAPKLFTINGSIYLYNVKSVLDKKINDFKYVKKYLMNDPVYSIDIDSIFDWYMCEMILEKNML